ncbi:MAG: DEAD/DEAH box helicase [Fimbriimonadaceae bacterium]|nr:DEAD/DEAH box helicase [Fimbriimonadaceae bacterium]
MNERGNPLDGGVQFVKGVGPRLAEVFQKVGVATVRDLVTYFPRRYEDRSAIPNIGTLNPGTWVTVRGRLIDIDSRPSRGGMVILRATISDKTGSVTLVWFNQPWVRKALTKFEGEILAYGQVKAANWGVEMHAPEWELIEPGEDSEQFGRIIPVYPLTEGLWQKQVRRVVQGALETYLPHFQDPLTPAILKRQMLRPLRWSLRQIHQPESEEFRLQARARLVFEDLFYPQLAMQMKRLESHEELGIAFDIAGLSRTAGVPPASLSTAGVPPASSLPEPPEPNLYDKAEGVLIRDRGKLPHWEQDARTYSITFRLAGTLPQKVLKQIEQQRDLQLQLDVPKHQVRERMEASIDEYLNRGIGECFLRKPEIAQAVQDALHHFNGERYALLAWAIMPNHVHVVAQLAPGEKLAEVVHSWKSYTSKLANKLLGRSGEFWAREYYDHLIRDEEELDKAVEYTLSNPAAAGLSNWPWVGRSPVPLASRRHPDSQPGQTAFEGSDAGGTPAVQGGARGGIQEQIKAMLPFELTGAQKRVIKEVFNDMQRPHPMNRLIQGDVGSGKTAVAASAMLAAVRCGYQAAMMAPTEILAEQHFYNLHHLFDPMGVKAALVVGKQTSKQRKAALALAASGEAQVLVGTHALIQEGVEFHRLGLAIIDEQHRFGVMQRLALRQKSDLNPDVLVMTATPIPRTLTMAFYGHLDVSVIDELPPGRKAVKTYWKLPHERAQVYEGVRKVVSEGRQAYFVCPMIDQSEKMQTQAAQDLYYRLSTQEFKDLRVGLLHGQLKSAEKEQIMDAFRAHELDILVSTVVIEVGVDVPNSTTMVIEDANRFGLAQLHQLRGRVGRGSDQSYCVLIADAKTEEARARIETMVATSDGFKIAEEDLRLRGPGEVMGTKQSGNLDFKIADLAQDTKVLEVARDCAIWLLESDPHLVQPDHAAILARVREHPVEKALLTVS